MPSRLLLTACLLVSASVAAGAADSLSLDDTCRDGDFRLADTGHTAALLVDPSDYKVTQIAAACLAADIQRVTGASAKISSAAQGLPENAVLIGTLGKSPVIDQLVRSGKLDVSAIQGKWESYAIATIADPLPGVHRALVIAGSDRRGTAYGVFTVSEAIGVTPWVWYADVAPAHRDALFLQAATVIQGPPSVKYRGIFLNDEDWCLQPWAAKTFEPETGDIGPKTYAAIFELLLRLKANYLWPAMHGCTKAFNIYPQNKIVADDYAIVMGSSHAEPMLRNNVTEWTLPKDQYNFVTHRQDVDAYWEQRVQENGHYENSYTLGIRGVHDSPMLGAKTMSEKVDVLQQVFADQRDMLARDVNPNLAQIPQIFTPYKEVLPIYQAGLKVPDDVTLVWPDDNYGYIRELPTADEQKRSGGSGVYYHVSYWGKPQDYLWLCTTPPALIWEEMSKAYDNGARNLWVLNVGDLKPAEIDMEFFLRMAWDAKSWNETAETTFLADWAQRSFGPAHAADIAAVMENYYRLNSIKPEHLDAAHFTDNYHEIATRLQRFAQLVDKTNALYDQMPAEKKDAFYELVVYPVRCSALMNQRYLSASPDDQLKAWNQIQTETTYYNEQLAGGKWRYYMSANPRKLAVYRKPETIAIPAAAPTAEPGAVPPAGDCVCLNADQPSRKIDDGAATWKAIAGLGSMEDSIALLPTTSPITDAPVLDYDFTTAKAGPAKVLVYCVPTHALRPGEHQRYSASIDGEAPQVVDIDTKENSAEWSANVLQNVAIGSSDHTLAKAGPHTLRLHPLDAGLVFEKIVIDQGGLQPTECGPPATTAAARL